MENDFLQEKRVIFTLAFSCSFLAISNRNLLCSGQKRKEGGVFVRRSDPNSTLFLPAKVNQVLKKEKLLSLHFSSSENHLKKTVFFVFLNGPSVLPTSLFCYGQMIHEHVIWGSLSTDLELVFFSWPLLTSCTQRSTPMMSLSFPVALSLDVSIPTLREILVFLCFFVGEVRGCSDPIRLS